MPVIPTKGAVTVIYGNGYDLTRYLNQLALPAGTNKDDFTMFGNGGFEESSPVVASGSPSFAGIHSGDAHDANAVFQAAFGQDATPMLIGLAGSAVGALATFFSMLETKYEVKSGFADLVKCNVAGEYQGQFDDGIFLHGKTSENATGNEANPGHDNGAQTTNGYAICAMVLAISGNDGTHGVEPLVQKSTDGSSWSTLATFGRQIAVGAPAILTGTGTVPEFLRGRWILDTGVTATFVLAVARR